MSETRWTARTKRELMIEVWERLDCESVGATEIEAVMEAVRGRFGEGAVETPARVARLLADEGAELRHAEILELDARLRLAGPYDAMFRNVLKFSTFDEAAASLRRLDNLRRRFEKDGDQEGLRRVRETVLKGKRRAQMIAGNASVNERKRAEKAEIAEWFTVWLNQPSIFEDWLSLRRRSPDFRARFAEPVGEAKKEGSAAEGRGPD
ncbi:MAG TPA: hypothetical protein VEY09_04670 [Pyrinomonadaceae bacterium]|nr:hypothetical protein [Pyrinomonadaceae bacterium]